MKLHPYQTNIFNPYNECWPSSHSTATKSTCTCLVAGAARGRVHRVELPPPADIVTVPTQQGNRRKISDHEHTGRAHAGIAETMMGPWGDVERRAAHSLPVSVTRSCRRQHSVAARAHPVSIAHHIFSIHTADVYYLKARIKDRSCIVKKISRTRCSRRVCARGWQTGSRRAWCSHGSAHLFTGINMLILMM